MPSPSALYTFSVTTFLGGLGTFSRILQKAEEHAKEKNIPITELFNARLYPDMLPLGYQVHSATRTARQTINRITGLELPVAEKNEMTTMEQLHARVAETIELLKGVEESAFDGNEGKEIVVPLGPHEFTFTGVSILHKLALPNFFFHLDTAYGILRAQGVPLGKQDYITAFIAGQ